MMILKMDFKSWRKTYTHFVTNGLGPNADPEILRRVKVINLAGSAILMAGIFWVLADIFILGRVGPSFIELSAVVSGLIFLYWQRKTKDVNFTSNIAIGIVCLALWSLQIFYGIEKSNVFWLYLIPPFAFYLGGAGGGAWWSLSTLFLVSTVTITRSLSLKSLIVNYEYFLDFLTSYLIVTFLSFFYERVRAQNMKAVVDKNEQMERFVYTVSHDLRSPLTSIQGYIEFIKEDVKEGLSQQLKTDLERLTTVADNMQQMINDLLFLSRIGREEGGFEPVDVKKIIEKIVSDFTPQLQEGKIKLELKGEFPTIWAIPRRIEEIYRNLLSNAIKYRETARSPLIEIGVFEQPLEYHFYLKDNGVGIARENFGMIFEPFSKIAQESLGTGIGLSIVRGFVEDSGGRVWVDSKLGEGSTFWFSLPKSK